MKSTENTWYKTLYEAFWYTEDTEINTKKPIMSKYRMA